MADCGSENAGEEEVRLCARDEREEELERWRVSGGCLGLLMGCVRDCDVVRRALVDDEGFSGSDGVLRSGVGG